MSPVDRHRGANDLEVHSPIAVSSHGIFRAVLQ